VWEGPSTGAGEECEEEEGAAEIACDELTAAPIPCPPVLLGGENVEKSGVKLSSGRRKGLGGRCF